MNKMTAAAALCFASQNLGSFMWPETGAGARPGPLHHAASPCNNNLQLQPDTWPANIKHTLGSKKFYYYYSPNPTEIIFDASITTLHTYFGSIYMIFLQPLNSRM